MFTIRRLIRSTHRQRLTTLETYNTTIAAILTPKSRANQSISTMSAPNSTTAVSSSPSATNANLTTTPSPPVRVGLVQLAVGADKQANLTSAKEKIAEAVKLGAKIVVLPVSSYDHTHERDILRINEGWRGERKKHSHERSVCMTQLSRSVD